MNLREAFDFVATQRPTWKTPKGAWNKPFCYNREHILRLVGAQKNVKRITKADLAAARVKLQQEDGKKGKRTPGGINRIMSMLNTVLNELVENEILDKAPKLKPLPENNQRTGYYTRPQIDQMVKVSREVYLNNELGDAILFGVYTGCRQGELLSLTVGDVRLDLEQVTFRDTKNNTDHTIEIHPDLMEMLTVRCENEPANAPVFKFNNKDDLYSAFLKVRNQVGLPKDLVWHSLRHTTGTWLAEAGVPIQTIAKVLNHKNVSTSERYTKVTDKARKSAINSL